MSLPRTLVAVGLGAGVMYFLDPQNGRRRRAQIGDRVRSGANDLSAFSRTAMRDLQNRAGGTFAELSGVVSRDRPSDDVVAARVRSRLGRASSHPGALRVGVRDGTVTLGGHVLAEEHERVLDAVHWTRGVRQVDDRLVIPERPETVSALQGGRPRRRAPMLAATAKWPPALRMMAAVSGLRLVLRGLVRPGPVGLVGAAAGVAAILRAVSDRPLRELLEAARDERNARSGGSTHARKQLPLPLDHLG
jgi:hypothetical protein